MKIIHFSDPHGGGGAEDWMAYFDKRWVGVFNYRFRRRFQHDLSKLEKAVGYILDSKPDLAVCTGDLTSSGQPGEFERVKAILAPLVNSSIPLVYTPGNHDCYVKRPWCVKAVKDAVYEVNQKRFTFEDMPCRLELGGAEVLMLNTARPSNLLCSWGFVYPSDSRKVISLCEAEKKSPRILVTHYPLIEDNKWLRFRHALFGQGKLVKLLKEKKIDLVLCGHVHKHFLKVDENGFGQCCSGSVTRNGNMVEIQYDSNGFSYKTIDL